jgi:leucyl aminopeptidase
MDTIISKITEISPDQSVVCITGSDEIPGLPGLSKSEREYAARQLQAGEDQVFINSYFKCTYIVRSKEEEAGYRKREYVRRSAYGLRKLIKENSHNELVIFSDGAYREAVLDFAEGLLLSAYSFGKYKTREEKKKYRYPSKLLLAGNISDSEISWLNSVVHAVYFTRDLINEPVNHLNSEVLAGEIKKIGDNADLSVEIFNKAKIESLKMGGLLSVNRGSVDPPAFCVLEWAPENAANAKPVVLVGKGIVYDTGGLNIKTGEFMAGMNGDMAGGAVITGVMFIAARTKMPIHLVGLVPITDNRPGGNAYTQGDIITMHNKMTVEVKNTDAEGRLVLADALSYASRYSPELIIDVATLTGSAAMTFGNQAIAVMTNADRKYIDILQQAGNEVYERIGELPFFEEYGELLKSDVADLKNVAGGREAGAIIAGKFLEYFAGSPLIHLDIAGTSMIKKDDYYRLKDGTGSGLRLLATFLKKLASTYNKKN